jgi:hypothetical protein
MKPISQLVFKENPNETLEYNHPMITMIFIISN